MLFTPIGIGALGRYTRLALLGHALMENRSRLVVDACLTVANGHGERIAALAMIEKRADRPTGVTPGAHQNPAKMENSLCGIQRQSQPDRGLHLEALNFDTPRKITTLTCETCAISRRCRA